MTEPLLCDEDIRPALRQRLARPGRLLIEELGLCRGQVRVDLAVVGRRALSGFEIKSDRDSLRRLRGQAALYGQVLDRVTLVVGPRHLPEAERLAPPWWGLWRAWASRRGARLSPVRRAAPNPGVEPRALVELLWHDEAVALLAAHRAARGVRGKARRFVWDRVCEVLTTDEIRAAVRAALRGRTR